jgi:hypothetical protein
MKLNCLVISDTHVGEPNSLLSFPKGLQELWYSLRNNFGNDDPLNTPLEVDEIILLGDIPDRTLSSTSEIQTQTGELVRTLLSAVKTNRVVYVIGNHDHTLWTNYIAGTQNPGANIWDITGPSGVNIIDPKLGRKQQVKAEELLSIFLEYNYGSTWNDIVKSFATDKPFEFVLANPLYAKKFKDRMYVFTHGTYFRPDVCLTPFKKGILAQLANAVADLDVDPGENVKGATDVRDYERRVYRFVDTLWPSARNNPLTKADEIWVLRRQLRIGMDKPRPCPGATQCIPWDKLGGQPKIIEPLCPTSTSSSKLNLKGNLDNLQKFALNHLISYIEKEIGSLTGAKGLTFVYGDTHLGGFAEVGLDLDGHQMVPLPAASSKILDMHVVNTGAWLVEYPGRHPACDLFAVDDSGNEYVLDVSYKDIRIGGDLLLELAEQQVGHMLSRVGGTLGKIIDFVKKIL